MSKQLPSKDIVWHQSTITRQHREALNNHRSVILWFTGLSGAGKSTLAHATEERLSRMGCRTFVLDGDNVRHGLCADLGFSDQDRMENIRRVGELAKLFIEAGVIVLTAFISPFQADRTRMRSLVNEDDFLEIYCDCSLEVCEKRDVKGFYRRARLGEIKNFTGLSSSYESPVNPELRINTGELSLSASVDQVMELLKAHGII
ncbi:adenylyl-sulfate kinase [Methylobacter sp. BlB1]|uniref:adenylyl-sulfate kinase n=1 Tax=Methylobacter sp. BlB1 TaxID=2785914 RepID=UPI0018941AAD|nr:adenylyl-sulfate kinase [Methylobacter sp. BlB1]MBF6647734.1 adenylyl-sulfate kinase [Methylobacter sp. BlB1]